jgi:uncharacterized protein involved in cysteine biosynthesis
MKPLIKFFDKLEDHIRGYLSRFPIIYSIIGGTAIVVFWRGVWVTMDEFAQYIPRQLVWLDGPLSLLISLGVLLGTGLFVSFFVTDRIILSGIKQEKKIVEKTETEIKAESSVISDVQETVHKLEEEIKELSDKL